MSRVPAARRPSMRALGLTAVLVGALLALRVTAPAEAGLHCEGSETPKVTAPITEAPTQAATAAPSPAPTEPALTPTSLLPLPSAAPTRTRSHEQETQPPAPTPETPVSLPQATRTRRATRTPRTTATAIPTPLVAGALLVEVAVAPSLPVAGEPFAAYVDLVNQGDSEADGVTLDVTTSDVARLEGATTENGDAVAAGSVVRWYVPSLAVGGQARLSLSAIVMRSSARSFELCVMVMSAGAPLEHCSVFGLSMPGEAGTRVAPESAALSLPTAAPVGLLDVDAPRPVVYGWLLLVLGLTALGAWLGLQLRGRRAPADKDDDVG